MLKNYLLQEDLNLLYQPRRRRKVNRDMYGMPLSDRTPDKEDDTSQDDSSQEDSSNDESSSDDDDEEDESSGELFYFIFKSDYHFKCRIGTKYEPGHSSKTFHLALNFSEF